MHRDDGGAYHMTVKPVALVCPLEIADEGRVYLLVTVCH